MAVTAQAPSQAWGRWSEQPHQAIDSYYTVDISGIIQSYDPRQASRAIMAQPYAPVPPYATAPIATLLAHHQPPPPPVHQHNPFAYHHFHPANPANPAQPTNPPFPNTYIHTRHGLACPLPSDGGVIRGNPFCRPPRQGFVIEEGHCPSPPIKNESAWSTTVESPVFPASQQKNTSPTAEKASSEVNFGTEVDTLMKAIQAKATMHPQPSSPMSNSGSVDEPSNSRTSKKRYHCTIAGCSKSFFQKTHLDIHERAHTGVKPYACKQPGCDRTFSQLGNLKTHERRHTGERPYECETCGKRFAQRGNVRAHKIVHDQSKPYICKLDDCGKQFTQLGNLKSHQNKFHIVTIRALTTKFASIQDGDVVHAADKELWEYFANLYKNSNKGIKGRGKDRKVGSSLAMTTMRNMGVEVSGGYGISGPGRGNVVVNVNVNLATHPPSRSASSSYDMFDVEDDGHSGSVSGSTIGPNYDDAPSDGFDESGRTVDMSFAERIY